MCIVPSSSSTLSNAVLKPDRTPICVKRKFVEGLAFAGGGGEDKNYDRALYRCSLISPTGRDSSISISPISGRRDAAEFRAPFRRCRRFHRTRSCDSAARRRPSPVRRLRADCFFQCTLRRFFRSDATNDEK